MTEHKPTGDHATARTRGGIITTMNAYTFARVPRADGMRFLRDVFGRGSACDHERNWLFVGLEVGHTGSRHTLTALRNPQLLAPEEDGEEADELRFLVVMPRVLIVRWGSFVPETEADRRLVEAAVRGTAAEVAALACERLAPRREA